MFGVFHAVNSHGYQVAVTICQSFKIWLSNQQTL